MSRRIAVTGIGVVSPLGTGKKSYWDALFHGISAFRRITLFDTAAFGICEAGEISDFDPLPLLGKKGLRDMDRSTRLICCAARLALNDCSLAIENNNAASVGVSIGSTFGSLHSISQFDRSGLVEGPRFVNPSHFPNTVINSPASQVSIKFGITGFNATISTGFCASLDAVAYASDFIRLNRADIVLTGGVEELCEETFRYFYNLGFLSGTDGSSPLSCPFDARRNGMLLSEGAAVLSLEDEQSALRRGAHPLARVLGWGNSFDPLADSSFDRAGSGLANAITSALNEACLEPAGIDYICAGANSTKGLDRMEARVIRQIFGARAESIPVSSIKGLIGESYSASGAMAVVAAVGALQKQCVFGTGNYQQQDHECGLDHVPGISRPLNVQRILITAADPYGQNSAVVLGR